MATKEEPIEARRVAHTMKGSIARATFIAGFAYYEMGRNDFARYVDPAYTSLVSMAFMFAVMSVGIGTFALYFQDRSRTSTQKVAFVKEANNTYIRGCFRCFLLALLCYVCSLARCGFVYFADSPARWWVMTVGFTLVPVCFYGLALIVRAQLKLQTNAGVPEGMVELLNPEEIVRRAAMEGGGGKIDGLHTVMLAEANTVASRAIYITGFVQSGVTRFISTDHPAGYVYIVFVTLAYALAVFSGFILSVEAIFIFDTETDRQQALAVLLRPLHNVLITCYGLAFGGMCIALAFMGWGCGYPDEAWVTLLLGSLAFIALGVGAGIARRTMRDVQAAPEPNEEPPANMDFIISLVNTTGSQATISSGFVFYNVVTFFTDILPLNQSTYTEQVVFLFVCASTLATGLVASGFDSILTLALTNIDSRKRKAAFLADASRMVSMCLFMYQLSMVAFLGGFGMFGMVKFPDRSYIPAFAAGGAVLLILFSWILINVLRIRAASEPTGVGDEQCLNAEEQAQRDKETDAEIKTRIARQNMMSSRALFFGGFAYFAMCFFSQQHRGFADQLYLTPMSLTFCLSVVVIIWSGIYSVNNELCTSAAQRQRLRQWFKPMYKLHVALSTTAAVTFPLAFAVIGWEKPIDAYLQYAVIMCIGTCLLVAIMPFALAKVVAVGTELRKGAKATLATGETFVSSASIALSDDPQRFLTQVEVTASQTAFIAGNVFYEILFAVPNGQTWVCYVYFIASTATFVFGNAVIGLATGIAFVVAKLPPDQVEARALFVAEMTRLKVKQILFVLNCLCIFSWLIAVAALGETKYSQKQHLWQPSLVCGSVGVLALLFCLARLRGISSDVLDGEAPPPLNAIPTTTSRAADPTAARENKTVATASALVVEKTHQHEDVAPTARPPTDESTTTEEAHNDGSDPPQATTE